MAACQRHERHDTLALQIIGTSDDGGFRNRGVADQRALHFHGSDAMTGDIDHVVDASHDPEVAVFIATCAVAGEVHAFDIAPVLLLEAFRIAVDRSHHRRPRTFQDQEPAFVDADRLSASIDDIGDDSGQRPCRGTGFRRHGAGNRRDHHGARFGLPPRIDDRTAIVADVLAIPDPRFRIDRLADSSQQTQAREIVLCRPFDRPT